MTLAWLLIPFYYRRTYIYIDGSRSTVVILLGLTIWSTNVSDRFLKIRTLIAVKTTLFEYSKITISIYDGQSDYKERTFPLLKVLLGEKSVRDIGLLDTRHAITVNEVDYHVTSYTRSYVFAKLRWIKYDKDIGMFKVTCVSDPKFNELGVFRPMRFDTGRVFTDKELIDTAKHLIALCAQWNVKDKYLE